MYSEEIMSNRTLYHLMEFYSAIVQSLARGSRTFVLKVIPDAFERSDGLAPVHGYGYRTGYNGLICSFLLSNAAIRIGTACNPQGVEDKETQ